MNNIIERTWKQGCMVGIEDLRGLTFQNEALAHTFKISGVDADGSAIALSGTPAGVMLRADNMDVALTCAISDGCVTASLPAECYDVPGRAEITIYLTEDGHKVCIYAAIVSVNRTSSGTASPGTAADVVDLVNLMQTSVDAAADSATAAAGSATSAAASAETASAAYNVNLLAPNFVQENPYPAGQHVIGDGGYYVLPNGHEADVTWENTSKTELTVGGEAADLKSALYSKTDDINDTIAEYIFNGNLFDNGTVVADRIYRSDNHAFQTYSGYSTCEMNVVAGKKYRITGYTNIDLQYLGYMYTNQNGNKLGDGNILGDFEITFPANTARFWVSYKTGESLQVCQLQNINSRLTNVENQIEEISPATQTNEHIISISVLQNNLFTNAEKTEGKGYRPDSGSIIDVAGYGIAEINLAGECDLYITGYSASIAPYGYKVENEAGNRVAYDTITGDGFVHTPEGSKKLTITYILADATNVSIREVAKEVGQRLNAIEKTVADDTNILFTNRITIKTFSDKINGYDYISFFGGTIFANKAIYAGRASNRHIPEVPGSYGKVMLFVDDLKGSITHQLLDIDYTSITGELRDVSLSVSRDGKKLYLSAAASKTENGVQTDFGWYLCVLNQNLVVTATVPVLDGTVGFGTMVEDLSGYLYKTSWESVDSNNAVVHLCKSSQSISDGFTGMTFETIKTFSVENAMLDEASLTYGNGKLIVIIRAESNNAMLFETDDLSGTGEWSYYSLGANMHSPATLPYYKGNTIIFLVSYPVSATVRYPAMVFYNDDTHTVERIAYIDDTLTGFGGYPGFVKISDSEYRIIYYDDIGDNSASAVYYKRINPYTDCDVTYFM